MNFPVVIALPCFLFWCFNAIAGAGVVLNEFAASNQTGLEDEDGDAVDWVELYNDGSEAESLEGLFLTDDAEELCKWPFPPGVDLKPGGYIIIFASSKDRQDASGPLHANFRLDRDGEVLAITNGSEVLSGFAEPFPGQLDDVSYGLGDDGRTYTFQGNPTPGGANDTAVGAPVAPVTFSHPDRTFTGNLTIELASDTPDAEIFYALEGQAPSLFNSQRYEGPFAITESTFVTARAKKPGHLNSVLTTRAYIGIEETLQAFDSNLPLVILDNHGQGRVEESKYNRYSLTVFRNPEGRTRLADAMEVAESVNIRIRGQSSSGFAKKQFRMEVIGTDDLEKSVPLLGMPSESDWVLGAPYADESLIRNALVYEMAREMGLTASRTRYCELFLKSGQGKVSAEDYLGVYVLTEAIEVAGDRVDIANLTPQDQEEPAISGGYLLRHEAGVSEAPRVAGWRHLEINEPNIITEEQIAWISDYMNAFDALLRSDKANDPDEGYARYVDVDSMIDTLIMNEFTREQDSYVRSAYYHKDRGGKLVSGPLWDYNLSFGVSCCFSSHALEGWQYEHDYNRFGEEGARSRFDWNTPLLADPEFLQRLKDRYYALRQTLLETGRFVARVDAHAALAGDSGAEDSPAHRNHDRWNTLGKRTTGFQSGLYDFRDDAFRTLTERAGFIYDTWEQHVEHIRIWADLRLKWMDKGWIDPKPPKIAPAPGGYPPGTEITQRPANIFNKGQTYYTTDGSDPRAAGGAPAADARSEDPMVLVESVTLTSRFLREVGQLWSAPVAGRYRVGEIAPTAENFVISEIMYHPVDPTPEELAAMPDLDDDDFEYVEVANLGHVPLDLIGLRLSKEIGVRLPRFGSMTLAPGERAVFVRNAEAFRLRYGSEARILGTFAADSLDNGGGSLRMRDFDDAILLDFRYSDDAPWPVEADGEGMALQLGVFQPGVDLNDPATWKAGQPTPGAGANGGAVPERLRLIESRFEGGNGSLTLTWASEPGESFVVQRSSDLVMWTDTGSTTVATGVETSIVIEDIRAQEADYVRIARKQRGGQNP